MKNCAYDMIRNQWVACKLSCGGNQGNGTNMVGAKTQLRILAVPRSPGFKVKPQQAAMSLSVGPLSRILRSSIRLFNLTGWPSVSNSAQWDPLLSLTLGAI